MITLYRDDVNDFSCHIKVEGASLQNSKARLLLQFSDDKTFLFNGSIKRNGECDIDMPALREMAEGEGIAKLEVIAESTLFEPWSDDFILKNRRSVMTTEVKVNEKNQVAKSVVVEKVVPNERKSSSLFNENCSTDDRRFVREIIASFKSLNQKERTEYKKLLESYSPPTHVEKWAKETFNDLDRITAKYAMYNVDQLIKKKLLNER